MDSRGFIWFLLGVIMALLDKLIVNHNSSISTSEPIVALSVGLFGVVGLIIVILYRNGFLGSMLRYLIGYILAMFIGDFFLGAIILLLIIAILISKYGKSNNRNTYPSPPRD